MVNHSSIKYISSLLNNPDTITTGDQSSIALFRQTFPYFVPVRYLAALESNKHAAFSNQMMSEIQPYLGDWILFCDFLHAGGRERKLDSIDRVVDKKKVDVSQVQAEYEATRKQEQLHVPVLEPAKPQPIQIVPHKVIVGQKEVIASPVNEKKGVPQKPVDKEIEVGPEEIIEVHKEEANGHFQMPVVHDEAIAEQENKIEIPVQEEHSAAIINEVITEQDIEIETPVQGEQPEPVIQNDVEAVAITGGVIGDEPLDETAGDKKEPQPLIFPVYTQDYFLQQGEKISEEIPEEIDELIIEESEEEDKSLMVVMSFSEWLLHFKNTAQKQQEEKKDQRALKTMWQKEKLAAALEEENEEIPENVFEMAVNSIAKEDGLASETLAEIYIKQGKYDRAIEMYRKLSLRNPQKSTYFARKIEEVLKEK